jgi:hypothetical protein
MKAEVQIRITLHNSGYREIGGAAKPGQGKKADKAESWHVSA